MMLDFTRKWSATVLPVLYRLRGDCIAVMLADRKWSFLKDSHPDLSLIGRGSCCWTKEGLVPLQRLALCPVG